MLAPKNNALNPGVRSELTARLDQLDQTTDAVLVRVDFTTSLQPWTWLRQKDDAAHRLYWRSRSGDLEVAGVGVAHVVDGSQGPGLSQALHRIRQHLHTSTGDVNYYGGMAFDPMHPLPDPWRSFGPFHFAVPRLEVCRRQGRTTGALTLKLPEDRPMLSGLLDEAEAGFAETHQTRGRPQGDISLGPIVCRRIYPDRHHWSDRVSTLLRELRQTQAKLVLACREHIRFQETVDALEVLNRIRSDRHDSYGFLFALGQTAFLGMSPEQLYERRGSGLHTEALAGTGKTGADLQASAKERAEHDFVVRDISEALASLGLALDEIPSREAVHWNRLCHLRTRITGTLPSTVGDAEILETLHPSAAVLGYPRDWARTWLQQNESLERGWYAGPVGRIGRDTAEFAVAIRSALVRGETLDIYAGAGIVRGSVPDREWNEIRSKMRQFHEALGLRP